MSDDNFTPTAIINKADIPKELRGYYSFLPNESLLGEGYIMPGKVGSSITVKEDTPIGLATQTLGANYHTDTETLDPYAEFKLRGDNYNVRGTIDEFYKSLEANVIGDNFKASAFLDDMNKNLSGEYGNEYAKIYANLLKNPEYMTKILGGKIGNVYGSVETNPYNTTKELGYATPDMDVKAIKDNYGTKYSAKKYFDVLGGKGSIEATKSPSDRLFQILYEKEF